jgi:hypothetical protein
MLHCTKEGNHMKLVLAFTAAAAFTLPAVAVAADTAAVATEATATTTPASIRERALVKTADGRKVGFVDRVFRNTAGEPTGVQIIYNGHFVQIPAATLAPAEKGFVTSLTTKEVNKL